MQPKASAKGHRAGCGPSGTPRRRGRPYRPLPSTARCHPPLHLRLQPTTMPGQWPPEPPWPSGQRTGRCVDRGVQADKRAIRVQAAGHRQRGGLAGHDLSVRSTLDTARPSHAWAAPTLKRASQSLAGQAGPGGGGWGGYCGMRPTWAAARHPTPERGHIRPGWSQCARWAAAARGRGAKPQRTGRQGKDDPEWSTHPKGWPGRRSRLAEGGQH